MIQVDKKTLNAVRESIRQGFSWATREGPLCEERKSSISFTLQVDLRILYDTSRRQHPRTLFQLKSGYCDGSIIS